MLPFGIQPDGSDPNRDERGPDTMNRLLLHGARYHDRKSVFVSADSKETPDWQADRLSIRVALALREELGVGPGDVVALCMPLSVSWAVVERATWGLGAASSPIAPDASPADAIRILSETRAKVLFTARAFSPHGIPIVTLEPTTEALLFSDLIARGGVLDTPERASGFRAAARQIPPFALCSIEPGSGRELDHEGWVQRVARFLARFPPVRERRHVLAWERPDLAARVVLHAGWADGLTTVVLESRDRDASSGSHSRRFASVSDVADGADGADGAYGAYGGSIDE
ncbi:MAG: AMP-binding protein [Vicinamibacteria bacterium]